MVYLPTFTIFYHILPLKTTIHVGKYTSPMDGMYGSSSDPWGVGRLHACRELGPVVARGVFHGFVSHFM